MDKRITHVAYLVLMLSGFLAEAMQYCPRQKDLPADIQHEIAVKSIDEVLSYLKKNIYPLKTFTTFSRLVALSPNHKIFSIRGDESLSLIDLVSGNTVHTFQVHEGGGRRTVFSVDGNKIAIFPSVQLWNLKSFTELAPLRAPTSDVLALAFNKEGTLIATGSWGGAVLLWDAQLGDRLTTLQGHRGAINAVAFSPDGTQLATGSWDTTALLWDVDSGNELKTFAGHAQSVLSIAFSPDGKSIATGSYDTTAKIWDTETGTERITLGGHMDSVVAVEFSPDGKQLATASKDGTVKLWDVRSGARLKTLYGHTAAVHSVSFSLDGKKLYTVGDDETIKVWDKSLESLKWLREFVTGPQASLILRAYRAKSAGDPFRIQPGTEDYRTLMSIENAQARSLVVEGLSIKLSR
ncbi:WD40 repeat domain-containing protein [Candidatus Dependentiae bacterium]|nr:WD40 repeat domain-containing protein [Candidatus Dependentiae bacterium]